MKRTLLLILIFLPMLASAQNAVEIDGFYFNLNPDTQTAEVAYHYATKYSGDVIIPSSVTYEGVEYSVTGILPHAFYESTDLISVTIPNSVTSISEFAFDQCSGLTTIHFPNNLTSIGTLAFQGCTSLTAVNIPSSVTNIGESAFYMCYKLVKVEIHSNAIVSKDYDIESKGLSSFFWHIDEFVLGDEVTSIGNYAFAYYSGLTSVHIPNSVTKIGNHAFAGCRELTSINIPKNVTNIGEYAFAACSGLLSIQIENGNPMYDSRDNCNAFIRTADNTLLWGCQNTIIPNSVTGIGEQAFAGCDGLTSLTIPNGVSTIGDYTFDGCYALTSIIIPNSLTSIGSRAFRLCESLKDMYCYAEQVPKTGDNVFEYSNYDATLHVPAASVSAYKTTEPWKNFKEIVALPQEYFPEGTKWTEIRLDTLKYDSWYSKVGDEWVPNFETIEYEVKGELINKYAGDGKDKFRCVYTNGPEWTDSLTLLLQEAGDAEYVEPNSVMVSVLIQDYDWNDNLTYRALWPGTAYQFDWSVGKGLYFEDILSANTTGGFFSVTSYYGIIDKIKEDYFGGVRPLKYVDLDGKAPDNEPNSPIKNVDTQGGRIIQGIGITEWNDGECLFGPTCPYFAQTLDDYHSYSYSERHYRSMLVHFERNGEVLYDIWPEVMPQDDYIPFVKDGKGKIWHVVRSELNSSHTEQYMLAYEDVVKDGKTYLKMCRSIGDRTEIQDMGLFREEDRKVYFIAPDMQEEHLMFDFSLKEGDTYETYSYDEEKVVSYEVVSVEDYLEGPEYIHYIEKEDGLITQHRYLRKWTVCRTDDKSIKVWIEGVGSLEGPLGNLHDVVLPGLTKDYLAYVEDAYAEDPDYDNLYLPFTINDVYGHVHGCDLPTEADNQTEYDEHHRLTYELESERLHVYGKVITQCGPNNYAYFFEKETDDPSIHMIEFEIQEVEPTMDCDALHATDFYVSGFDPNLNYIVVDNQGVEHQVINKTQQMAYRPFVEDGKGWKVGYGSDNPIQFVEYYYFDNDTIIDGKVCKQMMCQRYVSPDYPEYDAVSQQPSLRYVGAWYEEDKKVYFCNATDKQFKLMYDFSVDDNATLQIHGQSYVIGPKQTGDMKGFKGVYRDVMMPWDEEQSIYNTTWLEGVGGIEGPKFNVYLGKEYHGGAFLMSCTVGDEVIYLNDDYDDAATPEGARKRRFDFTHTIKIQPKARITRNRSGAESEESLYGEYNEQQLSIHLDPIDDTYLVSITSESGKPVYEKDINAGNIVGLNIDISSYSESRYTVTVENSRESFTGIFGAGNADVDGDGILTAKDIIAIINVISGKTTDEALKSAADVNGDGVVNVADIMEITNIMGQ